MAAMRSTVQSQALWRGRARSAPRKPTSYARVSASLLPGNVTATLTVATVRMKRFVNFKYYNNL